MLELAHGECQGMAKLRSAGRKKTGPAFFNNGRTGPYRNPAHVANAAKQGFQLMAKQ
jgi:hypothetical protein